MIWQLTPGQKDLYLQLTSGNSSKWQAGIMNTHSRYGDARMEVAASAMLRAGLPAQMARAALDCGTTDEMLSLMKDEERNKFLEALLNRFIYFAESRRQR